jgi:hypothetical protein
MEADRKWSSLLQCMYCTIGWPVQLILSPILLKFGGHPSLWHILGFQKKHLFKKWTEMCLLKMPVAFVSMCKVFHGLLNILGFSKSLASQIQFSLPLFMILFLPCFLPFSLLDIYLVSSTSLLVASGLQTFQFLFFFSELVLLSSVPCCPSAGLCHKSLLV